MHITGSSVNMASTYSRIQKQERSESLRIWVGARPNRQEQTVSGSEPVRAILDLDGEASRHLPVHQPPGASSADRKGDSDDSHLDSKTRLAKMLLELLMGVKIDTLDMEEFIRRKAEQGDNPAPTGQESEQSWGAEYESKTRIEDRQDMEFMAMGEVHTADGERIRFQIQVSLESQYVSEDNRIVRMGNAKAVDPLVINFAGKAAELLDMRFNFDLTADGKTERIPFLGSGSGFLVFDRNGDGKANDGTELFGPATGNGMEELAAHDSDGNGWIDRMDPIYNHLYVWTKDPSGTDKLESLNAKGVAAIYLGYVNAAFSMNNTNNETLGELRRIGLYVGSDRMVRTVQQIDLVV